MTATYTATSTTLHWSAAGAAAPSLQSFQKMAVEEDLRGDEQDSPVFLFSWQVFNDTHLITLELKRLGVKTKISHLTANHCR